MILATESFGQEETKAQSVRTNQEYKQLESQYSLHPKIKKGEGKAIRKHNPPPSSLEWRKQITNLHT